MKKIMKRILALTIVFLMIISTPFYISENINNNPYVYAAATFTQTLESELFKQTLVPTLISAGLVFSSKESIEKAAEDTIEWLKQQGFDWKPPDEPDGPNLEDVIKEMLKAVTLVSASHELVKGIVKIPEMLWNLIKSFVDDNYSVGENIIGDEFETQGYINGYAYEILIEGQGTFSVIVKIKVNDGDLKTVVNIFNASPGRTIYIKSFNVSDIIKINSTRVRVYYSYKYHVFINGVFDQEVFKESNSTVDIGSTVYEENPYPEYNPIIVNGVEGIVDNPNYDWNNNYTDYKDIIIPIETDVYGNFKTDENGYYLPSIDTEDWVDVQPIEIPNLDPSGTPIPEIPPFPDIENPDDDEKPEL